MDRLFKIFGKLFPRLAREANCTAFWFLENVGVFELKEVNWLSFYIDNFKINYSNYYPIALPVLPAWLFRAWSFARILPGNTAYIPNVAFFGLFLVFWLICQCDPIHFPQTSDLWRHSPILLRSYSILYFRTPILMTFWHACVSGRHLDQEVTKFIFPNIE